MQDSRALSTETLAPQKETKKQELISASASIFKNLQALFTSRAPTSRPSLLGRFTWAVQVFVHHWFFQIVAWLFCFPICSWQAEEDGVMGGHTRRSKHSSKSSSTVLCDSLEDWKQQIKVKGSIPTNQQRLTFTSQRLFKQPVPLVNFIPSRQWQIIVDASIEELCKDLRHWRATLHSKNTSAELLQPLVLKETDELASILCSRTANELRDIGVPCNVFFLSFNKWIPTVQSEITEEHSLPSNPRGLDLKIDEEFCQNVFLIELCGDLNGLCLPIPLSFVMNGSELTSKLFMVEQTAQYREEQKQRYRHFSTSALKDAEVENTQASTEVENTQASTEVQNTQGSTEVNCLSSGIKNYLLEFDQNCEFMAFISTDNHRLRCIVLPVITISLTEARGSEDVSFLHLLRGDSKEAIGESRSSVLALPSTSRSGEASKSTARNIIEEVPPFVTSENSNQKNTKKKKKKKTKKAAKENGKLLTHLEAEKEASTLEDQFHWATRELLEGEVVTDRHCDASVCEKPCNVTKTLNKGEVQCVLASDLEHEDSGGSHPITGKYLSSEETEKYNSVKQSSLSCDLPVDSDQKQTPWEVPTKDSVFDHCDQAMDPLHIQEDLLGTSKNCETLKVDNACVQTDISVECSTSRAKGDISAVPSSAVYDLVGQEKIYPAQYSLSKTADLKMFKDSLDNTHRDEAQNVLHNDVVADNVTTSFNIHNERWEHIGSHTPSIRNNFWTHRASEGRDNLSYRSRMNHNSFHGESRSSVPSWRHQKNDLHGTSQSWSRPRFSRPDDWPANRGFFPAYRQFRNIPAWEQLPNLRQPSTGTRFLNHWDNNTLFDESRSQGQSYSSFNMQQRKSGKSNKISQQYLDKRQFQNMTNERVPPNVKPLSVSPRGSYVNSVQPSIQIGSDDSGMDLKSKGEVAIAPCGSVQTASTTTVSSLQNDPLPTESERSRLDSSKSQMVEHVCNILEVVSASMKTSDVYEQSLSGKALCEFEKVAKAVAPVFKASTSLQCWEHMGCSCRSQATAFPMSKNSRQVPDASLSALWQWYEEPSCYGLKVKLSGSSERSENQLQAFFVPYLSGIQIFGWPKRKRMDGNKDRVAAQVSSPFDSGFLSQPIFSILLPRPEINNSEGYMQPGVRQQALESELGAISSSQRHCHCDVELLYEFFEAEKPQQRKPLTDRIKQLVSKDADAHVLNSAKMEDLHPSSWFAVAWYPIYKIPDETFRSAFLTYHCLSSLQSDCPAMTNASCCTDKCMNIITAPVVGLMSYNAQVKDWFSLTPPCDSNVSDILQQYLAKLEIAAASMARGSCDQSSSFKHADFTFFQSRGR